MKSQQAKLAAIGVSIALSATVLALLAWGGTTTSHSAKTDTSQAILHTNVITTYFWVGEPGDAANGDIPNAASAWDEQWQQHYGGLDVPARRNGYQPAGFTPKENPFYAALPYSDIAANGTRKTSARFCRPWQPHYDNRYSACKNIWLQVIHDGKTVYAQLEDAGPFGENDTNYVFGTAAPSNKSGVYAGLDVSPAVRDALGLQDVDHTSWKFVRPEDVPAGPWKTTITTSPGDAL